MPEKNSAKPKTAKARYTKDHFADLNGRDVWYREGKNDKTLGGVNWGKSENRREIEKLSQRIADVIVSHINAPGIQVRVLAVRPSDVWGERTLRRRKPALSRDVCKRD